jgi:hypothetical protein
MKFVNGKLPWKSAYNVGIVRAWYGMRIVPFRGKDIKVYGVRHGFAVNQLSEAVHALAGDDRRPMETYVYEVGPAASNAVPPVASQLFKTPKLLMPPKGTLPAYGGDLWYGMEAWRRAPLMSICFVTKYQMPCTMFSEFVHGIMGQQQAFSEVIFAPLDPAKPSQAAQMNAVKAP